MSAIRPRLSVIVTDDGRSAAEFAATLVALDRSTLGRTSWELIVVGGTRRDTDIATYAEHADLILRLDGAWARGAAYRRNRAAEFARGQVLVFLDAETAVFPETLERVDHAFQADPGLSALVGCVEPVRHSHALARYVALQEQWLEQRTPRVAPQLSAHCSAIRARAFFDAGQFNEWHDRAECEVAAELGRALRARGHRVERQERVRALARGRGRMMDVVRAPEPSSPWRGEVAVAMFAWTSAALFVAGVSTRSSALMAVAAATIAAALLASASLFAHVARHGGLSLALIAPPARVLSVFVSGATTLGDAVRRRIVGDRRAAPGVEALVEVGVEHWPPVPTRPASRG